MADPQTQSNTLPSHLLSSLIYVNFGDPCTHAGQHALVTLLMQHSVDPLKYRKQEGDCRLVYLNTRTKRMRILVGREAPLPCRGRFLFKHADASLPAPLGLWGQVQDYSQQPDAEMGLVVVVPSDGFLPVPDDVDP